MATKIGRQPMVRLLRAIMAASAGQAIDRGDHRWRDHGRGTCRWADRNRRGSRTLRDFRCVAAHPGHPDRVRTSPARHFPGKGFGTDGRIGGPEGNPQRTTGGRPYA